MSYELKPMSMKDATQMRPVRFERTTLSLEG